MPYVVEPGSALLIPSGTNADPSKKHLFVCLTTACEQGEHLLVSVSSIKAGVFHDPTCVIAVGEHDFVTVPSFVEYRLAKTIDGARLKLCAENGIYIPKSPVSATLLARICDGLEDSSFTAAKLKKYFIVNR